MLYELWTFGNLPYHNWSNNEVMQRVIAGERLSAPPTMPQVVANMMISCWEVDMKLRPSFKVTQCVL